MMYVPMPIPAGKLYAAAAAPAETLTVTGVPITVVPSRIVKVSVPSLTTPAGLLTVAVRGTSCGDELKITEALAAAVAVAAALIVSR